MRPRPSTSSTLARGGKKKNEQTAPGGGCRHVARRLRRRDKRDATAELPPVVVEASRIGKTPSEIPASVQVITRAEIAASGARDVADLLQKKSVSLDFAHLGANNPALTQLAPRGYGENGFGRMLVVVDGERLNSPDMNAPNLAQIGLGAIERIEILQGSQNVLHAGRAQDPVCPPCPCDP